MSADFYIVENDTRPSIQKQLLDADGAAIDVTGATVKFTMSKDGVVKIDEGACTLVTPASGIVAYAWQAGDTDTPGTYDAEFEITHSGGGIQTVPNPEKMVIVITEELA